MESWERKRGEGQRGARSEQRGRHPLVSSFLIKSVLCLQSSEVNERRGKERREKRETNYVFFSFSCGIGPSGAPGGTRSPEKRRKL